LYLSKLEVHGFKSFPYRTELRFEEGITAVVGPNGCGKTNLLDAIRWVLGEQRASLLRGSKMEAVIFNGTSTLKPLGMAEVTVTVNNEDGLLQTEFKEVAITRRLYRSGESEYLLNRLPCRLRDIVELFLNTGMGTHAYSVIQPEMIDAILSDKAEERRLLFEEAAGITKYKRRRREALGKLESTEADLTRIGDLYSEVEKQYNSLKRQVGKAKRFEKLKTLERQLGRATAEERLRRLSQDKNERLKAKERFQHDLARLSASTASDAAKLEGLHDQSLKLEDRLQELSRKLTEVIAKLHEIEKENSVQQEKVSQTKNLQGKCRLEVENISRRRAELLQRGEELRAEIQQTEDILKGKRQAHQKATSSLQELEESLVQTRKILNSDRGEREEVTGQLSELRTESKAIAERLAEARENLSRLTEAGLGLQEQEKSTAEEIESLNRSIREQKSILSAASEEARRGREESECLREKIGLLTEELHQREKEFGELKARKESLESVLVQYQDYGEAAQEILSKKEAFAGIIDSVANLISVKSDYTTAIESALGSASRYIVCRDTRSALEAASFIKDNGCGQACFLPLDRIKVENPLPRPLLPQTENLLGWASELVEAGEQCQRFKDLLLGNALVVSDFDTALKISEDLPGGYRAVTLEGELVLSGGELKAGRLSVGQKGPLSRKSELELLESSLSALEDKLGTTRQSLEKEVQEEHQLQESLASREKESASRSRRIAELEGEKSSSEYRLSLFRDSLEDNHREQHKLRERESLLMKRQEELDSHIRQLEKDSLQRELVLEGKGSDLESLEVELRGQTAEVNKLLLEMMNLETSLQSSKGSLTTTEELERQLKEAEGRWRRELEGAEETARMAQKSISENLQRLNQITSERERVEAERLQLSSQRSGILDAILDLEKEQKSGQIEKEKLTEKLHQFNLEVVEIEAKAQTIKDRIWEEYSVKLEDETEEPEQGKIDLEKLQEELEVVKAKLSNLGPVNLLALEDFAAVSDRLEFFRKQKKDLSDAKTQLRQAITKINRTARERFEDTFEHTRENFRRVFSELFEGGETDLKLADPADPLESPIEIAVRPRGKRFIPLAQLSGGERALTAISLLFAIYLIKPSPFCILDEIDAPLDDANTQRFLRMIKRFSRDTQFVVITHNKLSMEAADVLYGITMEEPGISKVVSVRFARPEGVTAEVI
jgi:chromosome segregation protein